MLANNEKNYTYHTTLSLRQICMPWMYYVAWLKFLQKGFFFRYMLGWRYLVVIVTTLLWKEGFHCYTSGHGFWVSAEVLRLYSSTLKITNLEGQSPWNSCQQMDLIIHLVESRRIGILIQFKAEICNLEYCLLVSLKHLDFIYISCFT